MSGPDEANSPDQQAQRVRQGRSVREAPEQDWDPVNALEPWLKEDAPPELVLLLRSVVQEARITAYSGPLPTAEQFAAYENVLPGAADRILGMAERAQELNRQRIGLQRRRINAATVVSLAMIILAGIGIWQELPWTIVVPFGLSGMITFFLREIARLWTHRS